MVIKLSDGTRAVVFEFFHLREIGGIDEEKAGGGSDQCSQQDKQHEEKATHEFPAGNFNRGEVVVEGFHGEPSSG
jgi:hypothetical protein